ncbi:MAG: hypothetical protein LLG06_00815, partial [Desulfobacteraceae bacterium]|nr:hypothetical protein [Desulfobacteraceae bacterium]
MSDEYQNLKTSPGGCFFATGPAGANCGAAIPKLAGSPPPGGEVDRRPVGNIFHTGDFPRV